MNKHNFGAHFALLGASLIYGANYTIAKEVLDGEFITPMGLVFYRILTASILFFIFHAIFIKEKLAKKDLLKLSLSALFGVVINQSFFITGLKYTTPINAAVLMVLVPIMVLLISILLKQEKNTLYKTVGVLLGATGTLLLIFGKGQISFSGTLKGDVFIFINALSYSIYLVITKPLMIKYNPLTVVKWIFIFALIPITPLGYQDAMQVDWSSFSVEIWLSFLYVLIFTTFLAYLLNAMALKIVKPSTVGIYIYLQPVLASIVALMLHKDELTWEKISAGIIIIIGVYLVGKNRIVQPKLKLKK